MTYQSSREASLLAVVAIPVRNERERISACVAALDGQIGMPSGSFGVLLFLNNCTDGTEAIVANLVGATRCPVRVIVEDNVAATAGWARRSAMEAAADWLLEEEADDGIILTTDADSRVGPSWISDNAACIKAGADAVAGRIVLDPHEALDLPAALHALGRLEGEYEALLTEIGARLDPEPWNPWPCHWTTSGATLAVRRTVYKRVGGLPALTVGEDRAFVALLRSHDGLVRHEPSIVVTTSGRLVGRAPGGAADTMKLRCEIQDSLCDDRLEPVLRAMRRVLWRRHLRHLHGMGRLTKHAHWASRLALSSEQAASCAGHPVFNMAFAEIEKTSPGLSFKPLRPAALPLQIAMAKVLLRIVRAMDRSRSAGRRSGNVPHVAGEAPAQSQPNSR